MKSRLLLISLLACLVCVSCDKDEQESVNGNSNTTILPIGDIEVHPLGDQITVSYTSATSWTSYLSGNQDGVQYSPDHGVAGTTVITITVDPNLSFEDRETILSFSASNGDSDSFKLSQDNAVLWLDIKGGKEDYKTSGNDDIVFDWEKSAESEGAEFVVESNIEWEVLFEDVHDAYVLRNGNEQIGLSKKGGAVNFDKTVKYDFKLSADDYNLTDDVNSCEIRIVPRKKDADGNDLPLNAAVRDALSHTIAVSQEYILFYLENCDSRDGNTYTLYTPFSELGDDYLKTVYEDEGVMLDDAPTEQLFSVVYEKGKIYFDDEAWTDGLSGILNRNLFIEGYDEEFEKDGRLCIRRNMRLVVPDPNSERYVSGYSRATEKSVYLPLEVEGERVTEILLNYYQNKYILDLILDDNSPEFANIGDGEIKTLTVETKGPWQIGRRGTDEGYWLNMDETGGRGNSSVILSVPDQNLYLVPKEVELALLTPLSYTDDLMDVVVLTQKKFDFELSPEKYPQDNLIARLSTETYTQNLLSSGPWTMELVSDDGDTSWLTVSAISEEGESAAWKDGELSGAAGNWQIYVSANTPNPSDKKQRRMIMTVNSDLHVADKVSRSFELVQDIYRFEMKKEDGTTMTDITIPAYKESASTYSFIVNCRAPWKITKKPAWVTVTPDNGNGMDANVKVTMTIDNNVGKDWDKSRDAAITIRSYKDATTLPAQDNTSGEDKSFNLKQEAFVFKATTPGSYAMRGALDQGSYQLCDVSCTDGAEWEIIPDKDWITLSVNRGEGTVEDITYSLANNGELSARESYVTVRSRVVDKSYTLPLISQGAYRFDITAVTVPKFGELENLTGTFMVDCLGPWKITEKPGWVTLSESSGNGGDKAVTVTVTADKNLSAARGPERIVVKSVVGGKEHTKTITVSQYDYVWNVTYAPGTINLSPLDTHKDNIKFKCSGAWNAESDKDFVTPSPKSGNGGRDVTNTVSFEVPENYSLQDRTAVITVASKDNSSSYSKKVTINQSKYVFDVPVTGDVEFSSSESNKVFEVKCSGTLNVSDSDKIPSWLTVTVEDGKLTLKAKKNTGGSRSHKVIIASEHVSKNSALSKTFTVKQEAAK